MYVCETGLLFSLFVLLVWASYTDCKESIIKNKLLAVTASIAIIFDILYYSLFATDCLTLFITNELILTLIAFLFYTYNLWAAGDSKLLFVIGLCIPGRFYSFGLFGVGSSFVIVLITFSVAFVYVIAESLILGIKNKNLFRFQLGKFDLLRAFFSYLFMVAACTVVNFFVYLVFPFLQNEGTILQTLISFVVILSLIQIREKLTTKNIFILCLISWIIEITLLLFGKIRMVYVLDISSWVIVFVIMFVRLIADKYNYQAIPTEQVKVGQILSAASVFEFQVSNIQGLPTNTTEDLRSRLSEAEVQSIKRWKDSAHGKPYIVVVRKIPFAAFISIGTIAFVIAEVIIK